MGIEKVASPLVGEMNDTSELLRHLERTLGLSDPLGPLLNICYLALMVESCTSLVKDFLKLFFFFLAKSVFFGRWSVKSLS